MRRWRAIKYPVPFILIGPAMIVIGIVSVASETGTDRYREAILIPLGVLLSAVGIAALRDRNSATRS